MVIAGIPFTMPAIWIGLIVIFLIIEGLTAGLVTIWFAVGALAALIAAMFHAPLWLQLVWFFAVSIAAFAVTVWTARADSDAPIPAGTAATVLRIEGVKLIVTPACVTAGAKE